MQFLMMIITVLSSFGFCLSLSTGTFSTSLANRSPTTHLNVLHFPWKNTGRYLSGSPLFSNADLFGAVIDSSESKKSTPLVQTQNADKMKNEAQKLRKEAAEMEMALREEARSKGLSEDVINKLIPIAGVPRAAVVIPAASESSTSVEYKPLTPSELKATLGTLSTADPIRFSIDLQRIKMKGFLNLWDSFLVSKDYKVTASQLKAKTNIDPSTLQLDDVGYDYRAVIAGAMVVGTILALSSSQIGGQVGFLTGYLSALIPIAIVGVGSIAPGLIGDVLLYLNAALNESVKERLLLINVSKFVIGYSLGLPIRKFDTNDVINSVDFYQFKANGQSEQSKLMFSRKNYSQDDVSRISVVCMAGSVAEFLVYGKASGNNAKDVNMLQQVMSDIEPALTPDSTQSYIRWIILNSYNILKQYDDEIKALIVAFKEKKSLEECIALLEGKK